MPDANLRTDGSMDAQPPMGVRNLHNYIYCPRLFYLQWVENIFEEDADTAAGSAAHRQADQPSRLDDARATALRDGLSEGAKLRSLRLESATLGLVGMVDVVEGGADGVVSIDGFDIEIDEIAVEDAVGKIRAGVVGGAVVNGVQRVERDEVGVQSGDGPVD